MGVAEAALHAHAHHWHPLCTAEDGPPRVCTRGPKLNVNCSLPARAFDKRVGVTKNGAWSLDEMQTYVIDRGLVSGLVRFFGREKSTVVEFGAGIGCYSDALRLRGVPSFAFEGAANVVQLTRGSVRLADLTMPNLDVGVHAGWVLCLEVAEHIPKQHEATFLRNLDRHNSIGIVMSWSSMRSGVGHVNYRYARDVTAVMHNMSYVEDLAAGRELRAAVTTRRWFISTSNRHGVGGGVRVWRRASGRGATRG